MGAGLGAADGVAVDGGGCGWQAEVEGWGCQAEVEAEGGQVGGTTERAVVGAVTGGGASLLYECIIRLVGSWVTP